MNKIYLHDWSESGREGMLDDFGISASVLDGVEILLASYEYEDYEGSAFVLFKKDGKLFEVNGSHCSCYGLSAKNYMDDIEDTQWEPEETTIKSLEKRIGNYTFENILPEIIEVLTSLKNAQIRN